MARRNLIAACLLLLAVLLPALPAAAQQQQPGSRISPAPEEELGAEGAGRLALHAFQLRNQAAADAIEVVRPLLSPRGTVELQPGSNTLVVRDSLAALSRIVPALRDFDRPPRPMDVEILVVRAYPAGETGAGSPIPAALEKRLRGLLTYDAYRLVAKASLRSREGQEVTYELGDGYSVRFRIGTLGDRRVRLSDFRVDRTAAGSEAHPLIHTNLNLWLDQTMTLGLARTEAATSALMVAVTCRSGTPAASDAPGGGG